MTEREMRGAMSLLNMTPTSQEAARAAVELVLGELLAYLERHAGQRFTRSHDVWFSKRELVTLIEASRSRQ